MVSPKTPKFNAPRLPHNHPKPVALVLGQVFTPPSIVQRMVTLRRQNGEILEPASGAGAFLQQLPPALTTSIEIDTNLATPPTLNLDFFDYPISHKFDTVIGNPPYVRHQDIAPDTLRKLNFDLFDKRSNLYLFFIAKALQHLRPHGEMIFIVPRELLKANSAAKLNQLLYDQGTITDYIDLGDNPIFGAYAPNCIIIRFERNNFTRLTNGNLRFHCQNGQLFFLSRNYPVQFNDLFFVKVGAVSGANKYFISSHGNLDFVYSQTRKTGKTRRMFYNIEAPELLPYRTALLARHIKHFQPTEWYKWGRAHYVSDLPRIYVNYKTRNSNPFFMHPCPNYEGTILAIFPKFPTIDLSLATHLLNQTNWSEIGFYCNGRYLFEPQALANTILPPEFAALLPKANQ